MHTYKCLYKGTQSIHIYVYIHPYMYTDATVHLYIQYPCTINFGNKKKETAA